MSSPTGIHASSDAKRVVIIGGGIGGITAGIKVKRDLGFDNFTLYEQSDGVGGTWHFNTYPGCKADVGTHWYSLSSDVDSDWDTSHVTQPDLLKYWTGLTVKYGVDKHIVLNTSVTSVRWDEEKQIYHLQVEDVKTGEKRTDYANAVISAVGQLSIPHYTEELEGSKTKFKGVRFHSSRWDHTVDLRNKRVAVIGNGCTACQFIPVIAREPTTQIVNFCRSPGWYLPEIRIYLPKIIRLIMTYVPFVKTIARYAVFFQHEFYYFTFFNTSSIIRFVLSQYIKLQTPKKYHSQIVPPQGEILCQLVPYKTINSGRRTLAPGCKRFIVDSGYLKALNLDNLDVNYDGVKEITETGIVTKKGQHMDFDVIIEATGFIADEYPVSVTGIGGKTIQEYYREQGGPTAYLGTTVPGFPNFFTILGKRPNTITGHGSIAFTEESQAHYILQFLEPIINGWASSFNVTEKATNAWNSQLHKRLSSSVWSSCTSWYRAGHTGKITSVWPGFIFRQWFVYRKPVWNDYVASNGAEWERHRRSAHTVSLAKDLFWVGLCLAAGLNWKLLQDVSSVMLQKVRLSV
ncbi:FAD/NAD-binding domain-containing protein [Cristinia sonorae]|uniref:FAD/NAD-binding domain-containing protein n=1 Tax=Cristinia sonorae TaxID=1940300 RepID=A0A8K0XSD3_9AGAR|nr:FAD/NAD-binding domain-containing protein [Cristinia sonorae]